MSRYTAVTRPFGSLTEMQIYRKITNEEHPPRPLNGGGSNGKGQDIPDTLWELVLRCWVTDVGEGGRARMKQVVRGMKEVVKEVYCTQRVLV